MNDDDADDEYDYMQTGQAYGDQRSITGAAQDVQHAAAICAILVTWGYYTLSILTHNHAGAACVILVTR